MGKKVNFNKLRELLLSMPLAPFFLLSEGAVYIFTAKNTIIDGPLKTKNTGRLNINLHVHSKRKATKQTLEGIGLDIVA